MPQHHIKDPDAVLDYAVDWTDWLQDGEAITAYGWTVSDGLTQEDEAQDVGVITVWLSGGTAGERCTATCHITTDQGREDDRTIHFVIRER